MKLRGDIMDIRWKDGKGNIINANKERIIYLNASTDTKTILRNEEVKKITIEDGMMNIFKDFENDLVLTIVIPKGNNRNAVKIFNEYDKTGTMYKKGAGNILLDVFLDTFVDFSLALINPIATLFILLLTLILMFGITKLIFENLFGDAGTYIAYALLLCYPLYSIVRYALIRIKRKKLKEV